MRAYGLAPLNFLAQHVPRPLSGGRFRAPGSQELHSCLTLLFGQGLPFRRLALR